MKYAKYTSYLAEIEKEMQNINRKKMARVGGVVQREMTKTLKDSADNWGKREVARRRTRQTGTKSVVEGPPGTFKGDLQKGIDKHVELGGNAVYVGAMAPAFHAHLLEFGTATAPAYPFINPAFLKTESKCKQILSEPLF